MRLKFASSLCGALALAVTLLAAPAQAAGAGNDALSKVTLEYFWSDVSCGYQQGSAPVTMGTCTEPQYFTALFGGGTVYVGGTFNYTYRDDGLPLDSSVTVSLDRSFSESSLVQINHEAALIYFSGTGTRSLLLGNNATADNLSGSVSVFDSRSLTGSPLVLPGLPPNIIGVFVSGMPTGISIFEPSVAAVPEPSTFALLALGLVMVYGIAKRRNKDRALPSEPPNDSLDT